MALGVVALEEKVERLSDDVERILAVLAGDEIVNRVSRLYVTQATIEEAVKHELRALELRHRIFPTEAHDQVAWTMLLVAYQHLPRPNRLSATSICTYAYAPYSTAQRWLKVLEKAGLLESTPDDADRRRRWVRISDQARGLMVRYFTALNS